MDSVKKFSFYTLTNYYPKRTPFLMDDLSRLRSLITEDPKAIKSLYQSAYPVCEKHVLSNSGTPEDARECFHDALIQMLIKIKDPDFKLTTEPEGYLYGIHRKIWQKELRNRKNRIKKESMAPPNDKGGSPDKNPDAIEDQELLRKQVRNWLQELDEDCRELLLDIYFAGMNHGEIAEKFNYSEAYVRVKKFRCLERLKRLAKVK